MKMVKSLLLVSAAGLVAVSGAQAADLPVKAKAVEYVKVCSLYGAGFYYIAGSDICMKIGGYVRFQESFGSTGQTSGPFSGAGAGNNRITSTDYGYRVRTILSMDTRQQTAYGTLRTYVILGATGDSSQSTQVNNTANNTTALYATRAFIQIAGFTFGKATSYFDFVSTAAVAYNAGHLTTSDTGDGGHVVVAYTAQLGNGVSATLAAEQDRKGGVHWLGSAVGGGGGAAAVAADISGGLVGGAGAVTDNRLQNLVGNIRIDQAWGSAAASVAMRSTSVSYYGAGPQGNVIAEQNGHPGSKYGWAATGSMRLNTPMIAPGDYFQMGWNYSKGAIKYASNTPGSVTVFNGQNVGFAFQNDGGFTGTNAAPGIFELTTAWSMMASYEHFWTPSLRTSVYGSYLNISRSDDLNNAMCVAGTLVTGVTLAASRALGCDLNSSQWNIGSRTQWNVTKDLYVGLDVIYNKLNSATTNLVGTVVTNAVISGKTAGTYLLQDPEAWSATWRIHRDIVP